MSPVRRWSSEWHRPAATNLTSTSPSLGGSSSSSMISQSLPTSLSTAALVFMPPPAVIIRRISDPPPRPSGSPTFGRVVPSAAEGIGAALSLSSELW